jgi:signal transduction histidine kinase
MLASRSIAARGPAARGTIRVSTAMAPDGKVVAEVRDDGVGLPAGAMARLFDPFAPPLPGAGGPSLSLAVAHGLVTSLGGAIDVESQPGAGTRVRVTLPVARPGAAETPPPPFGTPWAA